MRRREMLSLALGAAGVLACRRRGVPRAVAPAFDENAPVIEAEMVPRAIESHPYEGLAGFSDGVPGPDAAEFAEREERVQAQMRVAGVRALVVEPGANMQYLAGVRWGRSERPFLAVLRERRALAWVCPAFEERKAREQLGPDALVHVWREHEDPFAKVAKIVGAGKAPVAVDPEARGFIYEGTRRHTKARVDGAPVLQARVRKTPAELARLRRANEATKAALAIASTRAVPGMKQSDFADEVRQAQQMAGLSDVWVLALFGPAASFPHGTHEDVVLADGDLVLVDTGGALHGYRSDISRTWAVGTPTAEAREIWDTVAAAQAAALPLIRAGRRCSEPDAAARKVIAAAGFGEDYELFTHRLGHGIGLQVHERPYLRKANPEILEPGMTMSNEPGIYVPGRLGVRIEDIVAVTEGEPEVFGPSVGTLDAPFTQ